MSGFRTKVMAAGFLAVRPHYAPELFRRIRHNVARAMLPPPMGQSRAVAEQWASEHALNVRSALEQIGADPAKRIEDDCPELLAEAQSRQEACPVPMGGGGSVDLLYSICEAIEAKTAMETGVAYGFSSLAMLASVSKRGGRLASVDMPYPGRGNAAYVGCVIPEKLRSHWTLYRYPDYIGLPKALRNLPSIDVCHYDSDKSYEGRAWAYRLLWERLRSGGMFVSDDIGDNTAFRDFAFECGEDPIVVRAPGGGGSGERFVGILSKP